MGGLLVLRVLNWLWCAQSGGIDRVGSLEMTHFSWGWVRPRLSAHTLNARAEARCSFEAGHRL
jgi:hypothetical protein